MRTLSSLAESGPDSHRIARFRRRVARVWSPRSRFRRVSAGVWPDLVRIRPELRDSDRCAPFWPPPAQAWQTGRFGTTSAGCRRHPEWLWLNKWASSAHVGPHSARFRCEGTPKLIVAFSGGGADLSADLTSGGLLSSIGVGRLLGVALTPRGADVPIAALGRGRCVKRSLPPKQSVAPRGHVPPHADA